VVDPNGGATVTQDIEPLPVGSRLLHIGPHKTGTTTMQAAFHGSREALEEQGVHYPGPTAHPMAAVLAAATGRGLATQSDAALGRWHQLLAAVERSTADRVVISSEFFSDATDDRVQAIVDGIGQDGLQVVVTLRSLCKILPSQWQQYMQNRMVIPYVTWLEEMLAGPEHSRTTPSFWRRHRHDRLVRRWADVVGADRVTVVVVDERDKGMLPATFERLLGVREGTLRVGPKANRSLTYPEVELLRAFNQAWRGLEWSEADYTRLVRFGAARFLQQRRPAPGEERLLTPAWAVDRAMEIQDEMVTDIEASGVRVIGDLGSLLSRETLTDVGDNRPIVEVPPDIAARLSAGLVAAVTDIPLRPARSNRVVGPIEAAARSRRPLRGPARQAGPAGRTRLRRLLEVLRRLSNRTSRSRPGRSP
jgi:hypothetical protein